MTDSRGSGYVPFLAHFPGINRTTLWMDPASGSHIDFSSFEHMARTAERGKLAGLFLAESLRLREQSGVLYERDVAGRPDSISMLSGIAAVTEHLGLVGTINTTFTDPVEVARQVLTLDLLSEGRAGWNVVTTWDAFVGENFRRGGYLRDDEPYQLARSFVRLARRLWNSGSERVAAHDDYFNVDTVFGIPLFATDPVILTAGQSVAGRNFAAENADVLLCLDGPTDERQEFYADVKGRLARYQRCFDDLKLMRTVTFVLGDSDAEAEERSAYVQRLWCDDATTRRFFEQLWNTDLSSYDVDGPLPDCAPSLSSDVASGHSSVRRYEDRLRTAASWREFAVERGLSMRGLVMHKFGRPTFVGSPETVAKACVECVDQKTCDGQILLPYTSPTGLDEFVERVIPILQEMGRASPEYIEGGLRAHLGLPRRSG